MITLEQLLSGKDIVLVGYFEDGTNLVMNISSRWVPGPREFMLDNPEQCYLRSEWDNVQEEKQKPKFNVGDRVKVLGKIGDYGQRTLFWAHPEMDELIGKEGRIRALGSEDDPGHTVSGLSGADWCFLPASLELVERKPEPEQEPEKPQDPYKADEARLREKGWKYKDECRVPTKDDAWLAVGAVQAHDCSLECWKGIHSEFNGRRHILERTYEWKQEQWIKEHGIKVGSPLRVTEGEHEGMEVCVVGILSSGVFTHSPSRDCSFKYTDLEPIKTELVDYDPGSKQALLKACQEHTPNDDPRKNNGFWVRSAAGGEINIDHFGKTTLCGQYEYDEFASEFTFLDGTPIKREVEIGGE